MMMQDAPSPDQALPPFPTPSGAGRRIAVVGNCQAVAMARLYMRFVAGRTGDVLTAIPSYEKLSERDRHTIEAADLIVQQVFDMAQMSEVEALIQGKPRVVFPMVMAAFLWPLASAPHPHNERPPYLPVGPYGLEYCDSFLNQMIASKVPLDEAEAQYLALDVARKVRIDRVMELVLDRQQSRDERSGYSIAPLMAQHFRSEQIFLTPYHPNRRIALAIATQLLRELGATRDELDRLDRCTPATPFPRTELPVHPSVARHFGLAWAPDGRRYPFLHEGSFTLQEFVRRYLTCTWNRELMQGLHFAHSGRLSEARTTLVQALAVTPGSAVGHNLLSSVSERLGNRAAALEAARKAALLEPDRADFRANYGNLLRKAGTMAASRVELDTATALDPCNPHAHFLRAMLLRQTGEYGAACAAMDAAVALDPYTARLRRVRADCLAAAGRADAAITAYAEIAAAEPDPVAAHHQVAQLRARAGRLAEAVDGLTTALRAHPDATRLRIMLSELYEREGNLAAAVEEARRAVAAMQTAPTPATDPSPSAHQTAEVDAINTGFAAIRDDGEENAATLGELDEETSLRGGEARDYAAASAEVAPGQAARAASGREANDAPAHARLGHVLLVAGDMPGAEAALREAVRRDPANPHSWHELSFAVHRQDRRAEAVEAARESVLRQADNPKRWLHLAHLQRLSGDRAGARLSLEEAVRRAPQDAHARAKLDAFVLEESRIAAKAAKTEQPGAPPPDPVEDRNAKSSNP